MGLEKASAWPGPSADKPNPYFNLNLSLYNKGEVERMIAELERQDDEIYEQSVQYTNWMSMPFSMVPLLDSAYMQKHEF